MDPKNAEQVYKEAEEAMKPARAQFDAARATTFNAQQMRHDLSQLPENGWMAPGSGFNLRSDVANKVNTALRAFGVKDENLPTSNAQIASGEELKKLTTRMGFSLSRTMPGKEPGFIINQAISAVPSAENSPLGRAPAIVRH